jgi:signal transduction histidine kinase
MAALAGWALVNLVEKSLVNHDLRRAVSAVVYVFIVTVPGAWLVFAARFARQDRWLSRRVVGALFIEPVLALILVFTSPLHGLFRTATAMSTEGPYAIMVITQGPLFYVNAAYTYLLFSVGAVFLVTAAARRPNRSVGQVAFVLAAMLVPVLGNIAYVCHLQPQHLTDLTPIYFAVPGLAAAWLLFQVRVFDVRPIARDFVLDCLDDAVFVLDTRLRVVDANPAAWSLLPDRKRLWLRPLAEVLPELARCLPAPGHVAEAASEIRVGPAEVPLFWDVHVLPLAEQGASVGVVVIIRDITPTKRLQEELQLRADQLTEADRRKDEFLAMLAHELRNPLAPLRNALEVLKTPAATTPLLESARQVMQRQVQQLVRLVEDLLDMSRITRGKIQLHKEPVDLATAVARALENSQPLINARRQELTVALPPEALYVEADLTRLAQAIANLLTNAAKYTGEGGRIWLTAERHGHDAVLRVRDNGIGMTPEMLTRAFDLFFQAEHALDRSQGGLGIGLTLVRRLVELHCGSVHASSKGPGQGSEFVVRLPILERSPSPGPIPKWDGGPGPRRRVLVVDDNVDAADSLALMLRLAGHEVSTAYSGPAALEAARAERPDVVLLDIGMPEMDGYEVARRLRQEPGLEQVMLVALTGYGREEDRQRSRQALIDHHLVKPADPTALQGLLAGFEVPAGT